MNKDKEIYFTVMRNYKKMLSNLAANIVAYDRENSSDQLNADTFRKEINKLYKLLIDEFKGIDFTQFTPEELKTFDFQWWDENLICIPPWAIDCLPDGITLSSIDGEEFIFKKPTEKNLMKDARGGVTAYGFTKSMLRESKLESVLDEN